MTKICVFILPILLATTCISGTSNEKVLKTTEVEDGQVSLLPSFKNINMVEFQDNLRYGLLSLHQESHGSDSVANSVSTKDSAVHQNTIIMDTSIAYNSSWIAMKEKTTASINEDVLEVEVGEQASLTCIGTGRNAKVRWMFTNNEELPSHVLVNGPSLVINSVTFSDSEVYQCEVVSDTGTAHDSAIIFVRDKTTARITPDVAEVRLGQRASLTCVGTGSNAQVQWKLTDKKELPRHVIVMGSHLIIESVTFDDTNVYECEVLSDSKKAIDFAIIFVKGDKTVSSTSKTRDTQVGQDSSLALGNTGIELKLPKENTLSSNSFDKESDEVASLTTQQFSTSDEVVPSKSSAYNTTKINVSEHLYVWNYMINLSNVKFRKYDSIINITWRVLIVMLVSIGTYLLMRATVLCKILAAKEWISKASFSKQGKYRKSSGNYQSKELLDICIVPCKSSGCASHPFYSSSMIQPVSQMSMNLPTFDRGISLSVNCKERTKASICLAQNNGQAFPQDQAKMSDCDGVKDNELEGREKVQANTINGISLNSKTTISYQNLSAVATEGGKNCAQADVPIYLSYKSFKSANGPGQVKESSVNSVDEKLKLATTSTPISRRSCLHKSLLKQKKTLMYMTQKTAATKVNHKKKRVTFIDEYASHSSGPVSSIKYYTVDKPMKQLRRSMPSHPVGGLLYWSIVPAIHNHPQYYQYHN